MPYEIRGLKTKQGHASGYFRVYNTDTRMPMSIKSKRYAAALAQLRALEINVMHTKPKSRKRKLVGGSTPSNSGLYVDLRSTIPELAEFVNSTTDPSEVKAILEKLKTPTDTKGKSTYYEYFSTEQERVFRIVDSIAAIMKTQYDQSMAILNMYRSGKPNGVNKIANVIGDSISIFNTLKKAGTTTGLLQLGTDALVKAVNFIGSPAFNSASTQSSYSFKSQLKGELGQFAGEFGELGATIAGTLGELFGAKSLAEKNDGAVEARIKAKYEMSVKMINEFKDWWAQSLKTTGEQEARFAQQREASNKHWDAQKQYENEVNHIDRMDDARYQQRFGTARETPQITFEDWKSSHPEETGEGLQPQRNDFLMASKGSYEEKGQPIAGFTILHKTPTLTFYRKNKTDRIYNESDPLGKLGRYLPEAKVQAKKEHALSKVPVANNLISHKLEHIAPEQEETIEVQNPTNPVTAHANQQFTEAREPAVMGAGLR